VADDRSPDELSSFQVLIRCIDDVTVVAAQHLVDVFQGPALRLRQRSGGKQRAGQIDGGQDGEAASVAERRYQRPVDVRARGAGRQTDEAAD